MECLGPLGAERICLVVLLRSHEQQRVIAAEGHGGILMQIPVVLICPFASFTYLKQGMANIAPGTKRRVILELISIESGLHRGFLGYSSLT